MTHLLIDILLLAATPFLILASGFFSGSETALFSLSAHQQMELALGKTIRQRAVVTLLSETRPLLITILFGNMVVNVTYFTISTILLFRLAEEHHVSAVLVAVLGPVPLILLILGGEVLPKLIATRTMHGWSQWCSIPLLAVHRTITPLRVVLNAVVITPFARLIAPTAKPPELSTDELESLLSISQKQGVLRPYEGELLQGVLGLSQLRVRDIMTPRVDVVAFNLNEPVKSLLKLFADTRLSHIPVYRGDIDHIEGLVNARQVLLDPPRNRRQLMAMINDVFFVPELTRVDALLKQMRDRATTLAIAVDEFGGTAGLVTLEDIAEEMIGDIRGPFEHGDDLLIESLDHNRWRVDAQLSIIDWAEHFPQLSIVSDATTIGGYVMAAVGRLPVEGDSTVVGNVRITVERLDGRRLATLLIDLLEADSLDDDNGDEAAPVGPPSARNHGASDDDSASKPPRTGGDA